MNTDNVIFDAIVEKFGDMGEKTGWTYVLIPVEIARKLQTKSRKSFRIKGRLNEYVIKQIAVIPMGEGNYILPLNHTIRKAIGIKQGDKLHLEIRLDESKIAPDKDLMACLKDNPAAMSTFKLFTPSHQMYFSKWISDAKTVQTKASRIAVTLDALERGMNFSEMLRTAKQRKIRD